MLVSAANGAAFQYRASSGAYAVEPNAVPNDVSPYWVKMARVGNVLNGYVSPDGVTWSLIGSSSIAMTSSVYVGLAVTAHTATPALCAATFSSVRVAGAANTAILNPILNPDKSMTLSFVGLPGYTYLIQAAGALTSHTSWQTLSTNVTDVNGLLQFTDPNAGSYQSRFYRTALPF